MLVEEELSRSVPEGDTALTIGVLDGVHIGHQALITKLKEKAAAKELLSGVVTFQHHPRLVFSPQSKITSLTSLQERISLLKNLGVAHVVILSFTPELSQLSAREFIILIKRYLRMRALVIGPDFALGKGREGDAQALTALGEELDFTVEVVPPLIWHEKVVSSTAIRGALSRGDVRKVNELLGRRFALTGQVSKGDERGTNLGFPTANLIADRNQALPADGVYAARVLYSEKIYQAVINIGLRPTFDGHHRLVEAHILDFTGDLYGRNITIELVERLRGEEKFSSAEELKAQITRDVAQAKSLLERS
jgi:riboflavin kinase/FMN adenylyltransferase